MFSDEGNVSYNPTISGAKVTAEVVDQFRAKKVTAFKFKRRKGFHKTKGHRQHLTRPQSKKLVHKIFKQLQLLTPEQLWHIRKVKEV